MRKIIVAGNWKMNKTYSEAVDFTTELIAALNLLNLTNVIPVICPPAVYLNDCCTLGFSNELKVAAQDVSRHESGAYTGEISVAMLASLGVDYCLIGHSERRAYHHETDEIIKEKLLRLTENWLIPIICIGEKEEEREKGTTSEVIVNQLNRVLKGYEITDPKRLVIAYEPVWAIGTGKTATPDMAQEVHALIRSWLRDNYSSEIADEITILYGGSIKPDNFSDLLKQPDIDGGLIGGASLKLDDFKRLLETAVQNY